MHDLVAQFGINFKLLIAQIVNFGILFIVLKKFVYKPVAKILDERSKIIAEGIELHQKAGEEIIQAEKEKLEIIKVGNIEARALIEEATTKAQSTGQEIMSKAEEKGKTILETARLNGEREKSQMIEEAYKDSKNILRKALIKVLSKTDTSKADDEAIELVLAEIKK